MKPAIKLLSLIEANTVTGPAKNLLDFCRLARSRELHEAGFPRVDVSIVTFHRRPASRGNGQEVHTKEDAPNLFVATARAAGIDVDVITERFRFDPVTISQLRRIVAARAPDIIQSHMVKSHFLVKLAGLGRRYPWVAYHHGYTTTDLKMRAYNQLNRWSLPSATKVITVCDAFSKQLALEGVSPERIVVCHNSVEPPRAVTLEERWALRRRLGINDDERVILAVGRLSAEKGHKDLVSAFALLCASNTNSKFKLVIVGEGPEQKRLENSASEKGLTSRVLFIGQVSDVAPFYAIAEVLALASHSEGSPNVLLEAMASDVPVVATSVGGVPEIAVDDDNALLVPARNPRDLAAALERVLTNSELARKLSLNAKANVAAHFSPEQHAQSLIMIHQQLLGTATEPGRTEMISA
jgi:glycosyltransferase involved in cell wall biosynthesis